MRADIFRLNKKIKELSDDIKTLAIRHKGCRDCLPALCKMHQSLVSLYEGIVEFAAKDKK